MKDVTIEELDEALTIACRDRDAYAKDLRAAEAEVERLRGDLAETEARAERAEAERDAARKDLAECYRLSGADPDGDGWEHLWQTAVAEVRELRESYDELRRESRAVADAVEARAKQLDIAADIQDAYIEGPDDAVRVETLRRAASIVRGGR